MKEVKILVVDDKPGVLNVIKDIIRGPDCEITAVTSSHKAAEHFPVLLTLKFYQTKASTYWIC